MTEVSLINCGNEAEAIESIDQKNSVVDALAVGEVVRQIVTF